MELDLSHPCERRQRTVARFSRPPPKRRIFLLNEHFIRNPPKSSPSDLPGDQPGPDGRGFLAPPRPGPHQDVKLSGLVSAARRGRRRKTKTRRDALFGRVPSIPEMRPNEAPPSQQDVTLDARQRVLSRPRPLNPRKRLDGRRSWSSRQRPRPQQDVTLSRPRPPKTRFSRRQRLLRGPETDGVVQP